MGIFATNHIIIFHFSFLISHFFCTFAAAKRVSPVRPAPFESPRVGTQQGDADRLPTRLFSSVGQST